MEIFISEKDCDTKNVKELFKRGINIEVKSLEEHNFNLIFRYINKKLTDEESKSLYYYLTKKLEGENK